MRITAGRCNLKRKIDAKNEKSSYFYVFMFYDDALLMTFCPPLDLLMHAVINLIQISSYQMYLIRSVLKIIHVHYAAKEMELLHCNAILNFYKEIFL